MLHSQLIAGEQYLMNWVSENISEHVKKSLELQIIPAELRMVPWEENPFAAQSCTSSNREHSGSVKEAMLGLLNQLPDPSEWDLLGFFGDTLLADLVCRCM